MSCTPDKEIAELEKEVARLQEALEKIAINADHLCEYDLRVLAREAVPHETK